MSSCQSPCDPTASLCGADRERVRSIVLDCGAFRCGFARAAAIPEPDARLYDDWIARGHHASMQYLERHATLRRDPRTLLAGAATVVSCAFSYAQQRHSPWFADYALGDDYHEVVAARLRTAATAITALFGGTTRVCVDTAPLRERWWAQRAGLGVIGINNQLIIPGAGSAFFLGEILWTVEVEPDAPAMGTCEQCGACAKACPGGALDGRGGLDARRCLSYLTIEHRGEWPDEAPACTTLCGCDVCRNVCPMNPADPPQQLPEFAPRPGVMQLTPADARQLTQEQFSALFRKSAVKRLHLSGLLRNSHLTLKK